jgi:hypothetical protein
MNKHVTPDRRKKMIREFFRPNPFTSMIRAAKQAETISLEEDIATFTISFSPKTVSFY